MSLEGQPGCGSEPFHFWEGLPLGQAPWSSEEAPSSAGRAARTTSQGFSPSPDLQRPSPEDEERRIKMKRRTSTCICIPACLSLASQHLLVFHLRRQNNFQLQVKCNFLIHVSSV